MMTLRIFKAQSLCQIKPQLMFLSFQSLNICVFYECEQKEISFEEVVDLSGIGGMSM